jgi:acetate kinase
MLCDKLHGLGVVVDDELNEKRSSEVRVISKPESRIVVLVCPTNEELAIAQEVMKLT